MKEKDKSLLSPIEQYYESIIEKAQRLIDKKELQAALAIIQDELDAPYIPLEQQERLEDIANQIIAEIEYFSGAQNYEKMNRSKLFETIMRNNQLDAMALSLFFERYQNELYEHEVEELIEFLGSRKIKNNSKILIFISLANAQLNKNIRYYNNYLKEEFYINIVETKTYHQIDLYLNTEKIINDLALKEPSLLDFCLQILNYIYVYNFPQVPDFDVNDLAFGIFNYMMFALQGDKSTKNIEIFEYINNIIKALEE